MNVLKQIYFGLLLVVCLAVLNGWASIQNPDFESGDMSGWKTSSKNSATLFSVTDGNASSGSHSLKISTSDNDQAELTQAVKGLQNGTYSLSVYIKNSGGQDYCFLSVSGFGGTEKRSSLPVSSDWKQIMIRGIEVTNNSLDLVFRTNALAGQWFQVDNLQLVKDGIPYTMLIGGDISELTLVEDAGGRYYENGVEKDCLEILKNNGMNFARLRLYNDPGNPAHANSNRLAAGYSNPTDILSLARRAKDKGMQIELSFHYSDYWTNPGLQQKPHEWEKLSFAELKKALYGFTHSFMQQMVDQGTAPEFVSIGNETPGGILWPDGKTYNPDNWPQLAELLKEGYNAVKAVFPTSQVIYHLDDACNYDKYNDFFGKCESYGVPYDIIGTSYYPFWTDNSVVELVAFVNAMTQKYKKPVMVMEVGYNWNPTRSDGWPGQLQDNGPMSYPSTPQGQKDFMLEFISALPTVQNGMCLGAIYWDPVMITVPGIGWELRAPNVVDNTTLFDFKGNALPVLDAFRDNGVYLPPAPDPAPPAAPMPVAVYGFEGNVNDSSSNRNNGTNFGVKFGLGKIGTQAAQFNGTSSYVSIPASVSSDFSVAMWVKTTEADGTGTQWSSGKGLVDGTVAGTVTDWGTAVLDGKFAFGVGNSDTIIRSSVNINDGTWHHVAATRHSAAGAIAVYVDGVLTGSGAGPIGPRTAPSSLRIGSIQMGADSGYLNGMIDEVRLYDRVLSLAEVKALVRVPAGLSAVLEPRTLHPNVF